MKTKEGIMSLTIPRQSSCDLATKLLERRMKTEGITKSELEPTYCNDWQMKMEGIGSVITPHLSSQDLAAKLLERRIKAEGITMGDLEPALPQGLAPAKTSEKVALPRPKGLDMADLRRKFDEIRDGFDF